MQKVINIGFTSAFVIALMFAALPVVSVQAADLSYGYDVYDYSPSYGYDVYDYSDYSYGYDVYDYSDYSYGYDVYDYSDYGYDVYDYSDDSYGYDVYDYSDYGYDVYDYSYPSYSSSNSSAYASAYASSYSYSGGGGGSSGGCKKNCNPQPKPKPVCALDISPSHVDYGEDATVYWTSENATSATLTGFGSVATGGSRDIENIKSDKTYTLTVTGPGGTATCHDSISVEEEEEDLECKLKVSDSRIERGDSVKVSWTSEGAEYGRISPTIGEVDEDGSETVRPRETTTYKGTFYNDDGDKVTCSAKVSVDDDYVYVPPTPYVTLSAVPYTGFELGPVGTAVYWSLLVLWCLIAAYLIAVKKAHVAIARRLNSFLFGSTSQVVTVAPTATIVRTTAPAHPVHTVHGDSTDEFVLSQLARGRHAH